MRVQMRGRRPGDDFVLIDVAAIAKGNQLATAMGIIADRAPPDLGEQHFTC